MLGRGHSPALGRQEVVVGLRLGVEGLWCGAGGRSELSELNGAGARAAACPSRELVREGGGLLASSEAGGG